MDDRYDQQDVSGFRSHREGSATWVWQDDGHTLLKYKVVRESTPYQLVLRQPRSLWGDFHGALVRLPFRWLPYLVLKLEQLLTTTTLPLAAESKLTGMNK